MVATSANLELPPLLPVEGHPGWTTGVLEVTGDGGAMYDVPIWAPPGRGGIEPGLSLHYSSRAGESSVGVGWSITGLSAITRCGHSVAIDGSASPVSWNEDTYCLEGQRLVPAELGPNQGVSARLRPLQNGTESIEIIGDRTSPTGFIVHHENGVAYRYGPATDAAPPEAPANDGTITGTLCQASGESVRYGWLLTRVEDTAGNYMTIEYANADVAAVSNANPVIAGLIAAGCAPVEVLPTTMTYTGHAPRDGRAVPGRRSVRFEYSAGVGLRQSLRMVSGLTLATTQYLGVIRSFGPDGLEARRYVLETAGGTGTFGRRYVGTVTECVDATCREPLEFTYSTSSLATGNVDLNASLALRGTAGSYVDAYTQTNWPGNQIVHADIDDDGSEEILIPGSAVVPRNPQWVALRYLGSFPRPLLVADTINVSAAATLIPFDVDSDGRPEMLTADTGVIGWVRLAAPATAAPGVPRRYDVSAPARLAQLCPSGDAMTLGAVDQQAGGFPVLLRQCASYSPITSAPGYRQRRLTWSAGGTSIVTDSDAIVQPAETQPSPLVPFNTISLRGDGRTTTLYTRRTDTFNTPESGGQPTISSTSAIVELTPERPPVDLDAEGHWVFLDVNGDGLTDALDVRNDAHDPNARWSLRLNMGGFFGPTMPALPAAARTTEYGDVIPAAIRVADFDGDGLADLGVILHRRFFSGTAPPPDTLDIYRWTGAGFALLVSRLPGGFPAFSRPNTGFFAALPEPLSWPLTETLDLDGDGMTELMYGVPEDHSLHVRRLFDTRPGLLLRVERSHRQQVAVTYASIHARAGTCRGTSDAAVCGGTVLAVETHTDELGNTYQHQYAGPRFDVAGGGWLGFTRHTVIEPTISPSEIRRTDTYYQGAECPMGTGSSVGPSCPADTGPADVRLGRRYVLARRPRAVIHTAGTRGSRGGVTVSARFFEYSVAPGPYPIAQISAVHVRRWSDVPNWTPPPLTDPPYVSAGDPRSPIGVYLTAQSDRTFDYATYGFGVPTHIEEVTDGIGRTTIDLTTSMDTFLWRTNVIRQAQITSLTPDGFSETRTTSFEWGAPGSTDCPFALSAMTREPEDEGSLYQRTELALDEYCMVGASTVRDLTGAEPIYTTTVFDADEHMFPQQISRTVNDELELPQRIAVEPTLGVAVVTVDPNGAESRSQYDRLGRPRVADSHGSHVAIDYLRSGGTGDRMDVRRSPRGGAESHSIVDQFSRAISNSVRGFDGVMVTAADYDRLGRVTHSYAPHYSTDRRAPVSHGYTYDALDRVTRIDFSDGGPPIQITYKGNLTLYTDRRGHFSFTQSDGGGRLLMDVDGATDLASPLTYTKYTYGPFSTVREMSDHAGFHWRWAYDRLGRRRESHDPDAGDRFYTYDGFDRLSEELESSGGPRRTGYHYDRVSRLTLIESPHDGDVTMAWDTTANGLGQLGRSERDGVVRSYGYDDIGRLRFESTEVNDETYLLAYQYDASTGQLHSMTSPGSGGADGRELDYEYDPSSGMLQAILEGGETPIWTAVHYDGQGRLTEELLGNGTSTTYAFGTDTPWLEEVETVDASDRSLMDVSYTHDDGGNVTGRDHRLDLPARGPAARFNETYTYDALNRIRSHRTAGSPSEDFEYDTRGLVHRIGSSIRVTHAA